MVTGFGRTQSLMQAPATLGSCPATLQRPDALCVPRNASSTAPGFCNGDSGGPLVVHRDSTDTTSSYLLAGVVSTYTGSPCTNSSLDAYTSIAYHNRWIQTQIGILYFVQETSGPIQWTLAQAPLSSATPITSDGLIWDTSADQVSILPLAGNQLTVDQIGGDLLLAKGAISSLSSPPTVIYPSTMVQMDRSAINQPTNLLTSPSSYTLMSPMRTYPTSAQKDFVWQLNNQGPLVVTLGTVTNGLFSPTNALIQTTNTEEIGATGYNSVYDPLSNRVLYLVPQIYRFKSTTPSKLMSYNVATGAIKQLTSSSTRSFQGIAVDVAGNIYVGQPGSSGPFSLYLLMLPTVNEIPPDGSTVVQLGWLIVTSKAQQIGLDIHFSFDNLSNRLVYNSPIAGTSTISGF